MDSPLVTVVQPETETESFPFDKVLPKNRITILWGNPGAGKSTLTNHYELQHVKAGGKVLHLEVDEEFEDMKPRLADINEHIQCPPSKRAGGRLRFIRPISLHLDTAEGSAELKRLVLENKPTLLVLSPLAMFVKDDINAQKVTVAAFDAIKQAKMAHPCSIILHGHLNKKGLPTGSQYWSNLTDMSWLMEKLPDLEEGAPHNMVVTRLKARIEAPIGFEWQLLPPNHGIRFVRRLADTLTVEERFQIRTVLDFVYDTFRENYLESERESTKEEWDTASKKKRKAPNKWVTIPEFLNAHEASLGGRTTALRAFNKSRDMSLFGQMTNGAKGVQRFYPTERTVRWLRENTFGTTATPKMPNDAVRTSAIALSIRNTPSEEQLNEERWELRDDGEKMQWNLDDDYEAPEHILRAAEEEAERLAHEHGDDI